MIPQIDLVTGKGTDFFDHLMHRSQLNMVEERRTVEEIVNEVRTRGDEALLAYTAKLDGAVLTAETMRVTAEEVSEAVSHIDPQLMESLKKAAESIRDFHRRQRREAQMKVEDGVMVGTRMIPMDCVGVYAPGGRALYPSTVLMDVIPAQEAGVKRIVLCTPPNHQGRCPDITLAAASILGISEIYKCGGAQAVAAMAFGTATIPRVDKIVGPGNIYVALAKREVYGHVGIDMVAGPSEVLVIADSSARADYVAADLLSQAEHDPLAAAILVTPDAALLEQVRNELERQTALLPKADIVRSSLSNFGALIRVADLESACELANRIAPEHLELSVADPLGWLGKIRNAGAVFMGHYSPEPLGDYYAGPNHTLPTSGTARFFSALGVDDFIKRSSVIYYTRDALQAVYQDIGRLADSEGLAAHARSVRIRFEEA